MAGNHRKILDEDGNFIPSATQIRVLQVFLNQNVLMSLDEICKIAGVKLDNFEKWQSNKHFNKWFYQEILDNKYRYGGRIVSNLAKRACQADASKDIIELSLRVLGLYEPSVKLKGIDSDFLQQYRAEIDEVKRRAEELKLLASQPKLIADGDAVVVSETPHLQETQSTETTGETPKKEDEHAPTSEIS